MRYTIQHNDLTEVTIEAHTEEDARRQAMVEKYGKRSDEIIPHAPDYSGLGLHILARQA